MKKIFFIIDLLLIVVQNRYFILFVIIKTANYFIYLKNGQNKLCFNSVIFAVIDLTKIIPNVAHRRHAKIEVERVVQKNTGDKINNTIVKTVYQDIL